MRFEKMRCLICSLVLLSSPLVVHAQTGKELYIRDHPAFRGLIAAGSGYLIDNPEMIAGPGVSGISVSPDGRYVLAIRYRPTVSVASLEAKLEGTQFEGVPDEISITIWDSRSNRTAVL